MEAKDTALLQDAARHFGRGDLDAAAVLCEQLIARYGDAVDVVHLLALVRKQQGRADEAEALFRRCLELASRRADIHANYGNFLKSTGRTAEAEHAYREAMRFDPSFRPARLGLARLLNESGAGDAAASLLRPILDKDRNDAEVWNVMGSALRHSGSWSDAESAYRNAIVARPQYAIARHNLGALLAEQGRAEEAIVELEAAVQGGIRGSAIDRNIAATRMALLQFDAAEQTLLRSIRNNPGDAALQSLLARLRFMQGRDDYADEFEAALAAAPGDERLLIALSHVYRGAQRFDDALTAVAAALDEMPDKPNLMSELAAIHLDLEDAEQALAFAIRSDATDIRIDALMMLGRADEAMPLILTQRKLEPLDQWYVAMEATAARLLNDPLYERLCDYDNFVRHFDIAVPAGWQTLAQFNAELSEALYDRHRFSAPPLDQSLRFGSQTPRSLLGDPNPHIQAFLKAIAEPIAEYRAAIGTDPAHPFLSRNVGRDRLAGCWSVHLRRHGFHVNHVHSEGWISSAYYVDVPPETRNADNRSGWLKFGEPRFPVPGAHPERFVQPLAGRLVLFPSYFWHGTTPIQGSEPRLTIAFDVVPA